jgi:CRP-like cAMP-binding protein
MSQEPRYSGSNKLLASLPPDDGAYLALFSRIEYPSRGRMLTSITEPGSDVWFPHGGAVALTTTDASGRSVKTGMVGSEGCVGLESLFRHGTPSPDAVVQIEGAMSVISAAHLRIALDGRPRVQSVLFRFIHELAAQSLQTIACNRLHSLIERCCRWLLTLRDMVKSDVLSLTQDSLATLLGSGRPRVNRLLADLERNGILRRHRGRIELLTRAGLERLACECCRPCPRFALNCFPEM